MLPTRWVAHVAYIVIVHLEAYVIWSCQVLPFSECSFRCSFHACWNIGKADYVLNDAFACISSHKPGSLVVDKSQRPSTPFALAHRNRAFTPAHSSADLWLSECATTYLYQSSRKPRIGRRHVVTLCSSRFSSSKAMLIATASLLMGFRALYVP